MEHFKKIYHSIGWKTHRKLVVFLSDDWGFYRIASAEKRLDLIKSGFNMETNRFDQFDIMETNEDLIELFRILEKHRDFKKNHPVLTAMTILANPDFEKIASEGFKSYFYKTIDEIVQNDPKRDKVLDLYQEGIKKNIFTPEFHGREHINVSKWIQALQSNDSIVHKAFKEHYSVFGDAIDKKDLRYDYNIAFPSVADKKILQDYETIISDGIFQFKKIVGYQPEFFTAPSLTFDSKLEKCLFNNGIKMIDVPKWQRLSFLGLKINYIGKKNKYNQYYICRNCVFEPNLYKDSVDRCLKDISSVFNSNKPAIISNHRAAFVGGIDKKNRELGLKALDKLLVKILKKWPQAEFVNMKELYNIIENDYRLH